MFYFIARFDDEVERLENIPANRNQNYSFFYTRMQHLRNQSVKVEGRLIC